MKKQTAIFIDGPAAGRVSVVPWTPPYLSVATARSASRAIRGFRSTPLDTLHTDVHEYRHLSMSLPFGYVPYVLDGTEYNAQLADAATRMVELLVEEGHARSVEALVNGYQETTRLLESRITGLEARLAAVIANHNLSDVNDETDWSDDD